MPLMCCKAPGSGKASTARGSSRRPKGQVRFKDRTYASENGFIITGSKAKGPVGGSCTISQINGESDRFSALLSCSDAVVSRKFSWSFHIIDATHFERFDAMVGAFKYKKCAF
jgi:hypothetical protein